MENTENSGFVLWPYLDMPLGNFEDENAIVKIEGSKIPNTSVSIHQDLVVVTEPCSGVFQAVDDEGVYS